MIELVDTHCHIHSIGANSQDYTVKKWREGGVNDADELIRSAASAGVSRLLCVGTGLDDSQRAVGFVQDRKNCYATVGVHPHDAKKHKDTNELSRRCRSMLNRDKVVAIGEVGLDFYKSYSPKEDQTRLLENFLELASETNLPIIFHVRDAHREFWPIFDNFKGIRGVLHSFSATTKELDEGLKRGLFIGLNGIMTFTNDNSQLEAAKAVPLEKLVLETDAPYLTPKPHRGKVCKPEHVAHVATSLADLRGESFESLASQTTKNACELFNIA